MSLRGAIQKGVAAAFVAVGDIKTSVIYYQSIQSSNINQGYDPQTGDVNIRWNVITTVDAILTKNSSSRLISDQDWLVKPGDQFALIENAKLGFEANLEDQLEIKGKRWRVENAAIDPADGMWILQIRKVSAERILGTGPTNVMTGP